MHVRLARQTDNALALWEFFKGLEKVAPSEDLKLSFRNLGRAAETNFVRHARVALAILAKSRPDTCRAGRSHVYVRAHGGPRRSRRTSRSCRGKPGRSADDPEPEHPLAAPPFGEGAR